MGDNITQIKPLGYEVQYASLEKPDLVETEKKAPPLTTKLDQNFPNPFLANTTIPFKVEGTPGQTVSIVINIFDLQGNLVRENIVNDKFGPGDHQVVWDGKTSNGQAVDRGRYIVQMVTQDTGKSTSKIIDKS